jgi:hypothetical protein
MRRLLRIPESGLAVTPAYAKIVTDLNAVELKDLSRGRP